MRFRSQLACFVPMLLCAACAQLPPAAAPASTRVAECRAPAGRAAPPAAADAAATADAPAAVARWEAAPLPSLAAHALDVDALESGLALPPAPRTGHGAPAISYTFVEGGANFIDLDNVGSEDVDSYYIDGSIALGMFQIVGGYENQSTDFQNTDTALIRVGAGIHLDLQSTLSVGGDIQWLFTDVSSDLASIDGTNNGYQVRGGARWMPLTWDRGGLELEGNVIWIDINDLLSDDQSAGFEASARVHLFGYFSVGAQYTVYENDELYGINARLSF